MDKKILHLYWVAGTFDLQHLGGDPRQHLLRVLEEALRAGISCYQFREKNPAALGGEAAVEALARECQALCRQYGVAFVVNNDVDLALKIKADGIHVGQTDRPIATVLQQVAGSAFVGLSVSNLEQALAAEALPSLDYCGCGPIFPTMSKEDAPPAIGLDAIATWRAQGFHKPVVAIGGISAEHADDLRQHGADGVAVVSAIARAENVAAAVQALL